MSIKINSDKILVIGSSNTDMTVVTERHPAPGETVLGGEFHMGAGGKGANQAVAAKRLGGNVEFYCKVGDDVFGENSIRHYRNEGLDVSNVRISGKPSGVALITVDANAENSIVVASGANSDITPDDIVTLEKTIAQAGILLLQLETPVDSVTKAAEIGYGSDVFVVLNPAPASELPEELYKYVSLIIPNETEIALMTGVQVYDRGSAEAAAEKLISKGVGNVIVTMGAQGSLLCMKDTEPVFTPSLKVDAVDTTAAGDTFCGAVCVALSEGKSLPDAVKFATKASALTVQKMGAQNSIPYRSDISE